MLWTRAAWLRAGGSQGSGGKNLPCGLEVEPVELAASCFCCGLAVLFHFSLKPPFIFLCKGEILVNLMELLWLKHNGFSVHSCFLSPHTRFQRRVLILSLCGHREPTVGLTQHTETTLRLAAAGYPPTSHLLLVGAQVT